MSKNILLIVVLLALLAGVAYTFFDLSKDDEGMADPWEMVPENAALIWEHQGLENTWQKVSSTNLIWANLQKTPFFKALDSSMVTVHQHFEADEEWKEALDQAHVLVSAHMVNGNDFDFLYLFNLPVNIKDKKRNAYLKAHLQKAPKGAGLRESTVGTDIYYQLPTEEGGTHFFTQRAGVVLASTTVALLENATAHYAKGHPITESNAFQKVRRTTGPGNDGALFIRSSEFENVIASFLSPDHKSDPVLPGEWMELDMNILPNKLDLAGMIDTSTHNNALVSVALTQASGRTRIEEMAPPNTAALFSIALTDGAALIQALEASGGRDPAAIQQWNDSLDTDLDIALLSWMDEELGKIIVSEGEGTRTAFVVGTSSESKAREHLAALGLSIDAYMGGADEPRPTMHHYGTEIGFLEQAHLFEAVLGEHFKELVMPYYAVLGSRVVFSDDLALVRSIITHVKDRTTLGQDLSFRDLNENASEQNSLYCYVSLPRFRPLLNTYLNKENAARTEEWSEVWNDMGGVVLQISGSGNGMSFLNITMRHQPAELKESNTLWEAELTAPLAIKPQLLKDHNSGALDIFVQDETNTIHLFSNTGKALWNAELTGRIMGDVHQVDRYKNGKLQMLFNTADKIFLVDRNGNNVEGFPIRLPANATAPVAVFDYEKDRDHRLLVPCADGELRLYTLEGKAVKGWKAKRTEAPVGMSPVHIRIRNKDYIYCFDSTGVQYVLDRQGKTRYTTQARMPLPTPTEPIIRVNTEIGGTKVFYHSDASLIEWTIDGDLDTLRPAGEFPIHGMVLADVDGDREQETVYTSENILTVLQGSKVLLSETFNAPVRHGPVRYNFNDGDKVGLTTSGEEGVWLFDANIGPLPGMPLKGNTAFSIGDLNRDGRFELVVGSGAQLLVHQLR